MKSNRRTGRKTAKHGTTPCKRCSGEASGTSSPTILRSKLCGFTAGGSGTASIEAVTIKTLSTNAIYTSDFMATLTGLIIADSKTADSKTADSKTADSKTADSKTADSKTL